MIVRWPAKAKPDGVHRNQLGHIIDFMPTFIEAAGGQYPTEHADTKILPMEGISLIPAITGNAPLERDIVCWEHHGNRAIRKGDWKLVARGEKGAWELYDMKTDRTEINNLAADNPKLVKELDVLWWKWAGRCRVLPMNPNHKGEFLKRKQEAQKRKKQREAEAKQREAEAKQREANPGT